MRLGQVQSAYHCGYPVCKLLHACITPHVNLLLSGDGHALVA